MPRDSRDDHFPRVKNLDSFKITLREGIKAEQKTVQKNPIILAQYGKPACQVITLQKCIDSGSNSTNFIFSASVRSIHISEAIMNWNKPKVKEICIGMEINDYFPAEF